MLDHHLRNGLAAQERTTYLDVNHLLKYVGSDLDERHAVGAVAVRGVVDQNVDSPILLQHTFDHGVNVGFVGHVAHEGQGASAQGAHLVCGALDVAPSDFLLVGRERGGVAARARQHEIRTQLCQGVRRGVANAPPSSRACDYGYLAVKLTHAAPLLPGRIWPE